MARTVTTDDVNACIREFGLFGLSTSELRQLIREDEKARDFATQVRHAAARHVLVAKLNTNAEAMPQAPAAVARAEPDDEPLPMGTTGSTLNEYTRLHMELAEMLSSGRISKHALKDDYHCLVDTLERINRARRASGLDEIPLVTDDR